MAKKGRPFGSRLTKKLKSACISPYSAIASVLPAILVILIFGTIPAVLNVVMSFTDYNGNWQVTDFVGFRNYVTIFSRGNALGDQFRLSFLNTLKYTACTVIPTQLLALGAALMVNMKIKGATVFRTLYFLPNILGTAVICAIWSMIFSATPQSPAMQFLTWLLGRPPETQLLGDSRISLYLIVVVAIWSSFGFSMVLYLAGLQNISRDYYEAAVLDGANAWRRLTSITLPLLRPALVICFWLSINGALGTSEFMIFLTNGQWNTSTMGYFIYNTALSSANSKGEAAAISLMFSIFVSAVMIAFNAVFQRKEAEA